MFEPAEHADRRGDPRCAPVQIWSKVRADVAATRPAESADRRRAPHRRDYPLRQSVCRPPAGGGDGRFNSLARAAMAREASISRRVKTDPTPEEPSLIPIRQDG